MDKVIEYIEKYGFKGALLGGIITIFWLITKSTWFSNFMTKMVDKFMSYFMSGKKNSKIKTINESDITSHEIFKYIDFWMYSKIPTFQFSTEYRTISFRRYLVLFLKKHKENIKKYVESKSFEVMDESELWNSLLTLINDIIYDYEKEMDSSGIPKVIIEKMKVKNNDTISLTIDLIEGVCSSQFYASEKNRLKVYSILNIMLSILENTISNSENICNSINGQLKGMVIYDGGKEYKEP